MASAHQTIVMKPLKAEPNANGPVKMLSVWEIAQLADSPIPNTFFVASQPRQSLLTTNCNSNLILCSEQLMFMKEEKVSNQFLPLRPGSLKPKSIK